MQDLKTDKKLSSQDYWDDVLELVQLPRVNNRRSYHYRVSMDFIDPCLRGKEYHTLFEVGCGSSGWLPYFANEYNLTVSGMDYSEIGCKLARENLEILKIPYGEIFCNDIFDADFTLGKKYDIVFSYGVIEHFNDPTEIIRIFCSVLNEGGLLITLVPNLNGCMGWLSRLWVPDIYEMHRLMTKGQLKSMHEDNQLQNIMTNYAGTFSLAVIPLVRSKHWLLKEKTWRRKIALSFFNLFDKITAKLITFLGLNMPSKGFSPYIISIAEKKK